MSISFSNFKQSLLRYAKAFVLPENALSSRQKWILGLINLGFVVIFWVMSSFLVNDMVQDGSYRKPFFITYINTGLFSLYLIPYLNYENYTCKQFLQLIKQEYDKTKVDLIKFDNETYGSHDDLEEFRDIHEKVGIYETIKLSFQFLILWFSANLVTNASLSYTSVASQTILSSTSSFFTLIIGYLYSIEKININKIIGILLSFSGVFIVTKIDSSSDDYTGFSKMVFVGNLLALLGALIYGIYTILLKFKISIPNTTKERDLNTHLFFGFVGIFCLIGMWPFFFILNYLDYETFQLPPTKKILAILLTNGFITFISDFCWCKAVLLTSPLTVTVGLSMTIPLAMVGDWILKSFIINWGYLFGAMIVTMGFLIINRDEEADFVSDDF